MDKKRRWQRYLLISVLIATFYNILPTLLYYGQNLEKPITLFEAERIAASVEKRVNTLENENIDWVRSYCSLLQIKPLRIQLSEETPGQITVSFARLEDAKMLRALLPRAGALIPFAPARLALFPQEEESKEVLIQRMLPCKWEKEWLHYVPGGLVVESAKIGEKIREVTEKTISKFWQPQHPDFQQEGTITCRFHEGAVYVTAQGAERLAKLYQGISECDLVHFFEEDIRSLISILYAQGFQFAPSHAAPEGIASSGDLLFVQNNFLPSLLAASREKFQWKEEAPFLPLSDREERLLTVNRIENEIHENLLQWTEDFRAAQVHLDPKVRLDIPRPTKNAFCQNLLLSFKKYWRGDERKVVRWGLDLSGGKSVQIELIDADNCVVKEESAIRKGIEELTERVNRMGVSEVSIRQMGHHIVLDFPGSQKLNARDLITASTMSFYLVNETFSLHNPEMAENVNRFLQDIWNEAVLTDCKDLQSLQAIAERRLNAEKRSEAAEHLWNAGLRLSSSQIVPMRGEEHKEWHGQSHPLVILFKEAALEGRSLTNIHAAYDPSKGNFLNFSVKGEEAKERLFSWTNRYCKEAIAGTDLATPTHGRGWRMAAVLNDQIISSPTLEAALRDGGSISGSFSSREVDHLSKDLESGSLSFTPRILLEKNVHPELGKKDRMQGISATLFACALVIGSMVLFYRFAGFVASCAVLLNILILWAILQNLEAVLTLGSIAGIVLTVGMAVDANVLVFERVKEELARTANLSLALQAGYRKAYGAIIDSNLTTLIAALILLNFHAGPIKSFALNLLIGLASSLFTALFATRFFFSGWIQKKKNPRLTMKSWMKNLELPLLTWAKPFCVAALAVILVGNWGALTKKESLLGLDFTGGYATQLAIEEGNATAVKEALIAHGAASSDLQIQDLGSAGQMRLLLASALEMPGKPFHGMPSGELTPRIDWLVHSLQEEGLSLTPASKTEISSHWTAMSGQISNTMRTQALAALSLAFIAIFAYLAIRFEFRYAIAALLCLVHDLLITLGVLGLLHWMGVAVQIDLTTIAALMTIIGYSLNDTIIIFDRVREERALTPQKKWRDIVHHSLNATLSRTTITSGTTLLVLIALLLFGGASLFNFSLTLTIGVLLGTLSSWFVASPLLLLLHKGRGVKA
ncbi:MAG: protein translocase subunit SecD [Verrucomicrobiota bacterium]|nr:protein translocase subunit SecD [Verrucomicrobiota bacterium]